LLPKDIIKVIAAKGDIAKTTQKQMKIVIMV
jgi:hypothetical protein